MNEGEFIVSRAAWLRYWKLGYEPMVAVEEDPDCFTEHGSEFAIERWADDGGRA